MVDRMVVHVVVAIQLVGSHIWNYTTRLSILYYFDLRFVTCPKAH